MTPTQITRQNKVCKDPQFPSYEFEIMFDMLRSKKDQKAEHQKSALVYKKVLSYLTNFNKRMSQRVFNG